MRLLEREGERSELERAVRAAEAGSGSVVLVEADGGLGKTSLLDEAEALGGMVGLTVLRARGSELERDFAFGCVRQLLEPVVAGMGQEEREELFEGPPGLAEPLFGDAAASDPGADPTFPVLHGLYWLVHRIASSRPLVLVVDDLHWADASSLTFLEFLLTRIDELACLVVLATRPLEPGAHETLLQAVASRSDVPMLRPRPLSPEATTRLVADVLGRAVAPEFGVACHAACAGNPLYLSLLARELSHAQIDPSATEAPRVSALGPKEVSRALLLRLASLPEAAALVRALTVLGDGAEVSEAAALAGIQETEAAEAADRLVRMSVLRRSRRLEFIHPIVREAFAADMAPRERASAHARAARLLRERGASPERVAAQLLATPTADDPAVVESLREAAAEAQRRGDPGTAAEYLTRAVAECQDERSRGPLVLELALAETTAWRETAFDRLREGVRLTDDPALRLVGRRALAVRLLLQGLVPEASEVLEAALAELPDSEGEDALMVEADLVASYALARRPSEARFRARLERRSDVTGSTPAERALLGVLSFESAKQGRPAADTIDLAERAYAGGLLIGEQVPLAFPVFSVCYTMSGVDAADLAGEAIEAVMQRSRREGAVGGFAMGSFLHSDLCYRRGDVARAEVSARSALELTPPVLQFSTLANLSALLDALIERGEREAAQEALERFGLWGELPESGMSSVMLERRGRLRVAQGEVEAGLADLLAAGRGNQAGVVVGPAFAAWGSNAALAHHRLGDGESARRLAADELERARVVGAPRAIGIALRACGLVGQGEERLTHLSEAVAVLEASVARLELARALVDLGAELRRSNRRSDARERLERGLELARACGAPPLAELAVKELAAAGARPRKDLYADRDALTPSEERVALMAADGLANAEIAQALFVSLKTVEAHLSSAYRKLGIGSRHQLGRVLETDEPRPEGQPA